MFTRKMCCMTGKTNQSFSKMVFHELPVCFMFHVNSQTFVIPKSKIYLATYASSYNFERKIKQITHCCNCFRVQVHWSFIPEGSAEEEAIPMDAEATAPPDSPSSSFLYIRNPAKRHEGQYICRIRQMTDVAKMIVEERSK